MRGCDHDVDRSPRGVVWCGVVWCGVGWGGVGWGGAVWGGVVWGGVVRCGVVWCGVAWRGLAWHGVAWSGLVCQPPPPPPTHTQPQPPFTASYLAPHFLYCCPANIFIASFAALSLAPLYSHLQPCCPLLNWPWKGPDGRFPHIIRMNLCPPPLYCGGPNLRPVSVSLNPLSCSRLFPHLLLNARLMLNLWGRSPQKTSRIV